MDSYKGKYWVILAITLLSIALVLPTFARSIIPENWISKPIRLGLDLRGGTYLILGVKTKEAVESQLRSIAGSLRHELRENNLQILRARATDKPGIELTFLGDQNVQTISAQVRKEYSILKEGASRKEDGKTFVEFVVLEPDVKDIEKNAVDQAIETIRNRVDQFGVAEPTIQRSGDERVMVQLPDITNVDSVKETIGSVAKLEFMLVQDDSFGGTAGVGTRTLPSREGGNIRLQDEVLMTGDAIQTASVDINPQTNEIEVLLKLNGVGAKTFDRITGDNVNRRLAIVLDGVVQSAPNIRDRISGGSAQITGNFTPEEAQRLAIVLRSGALPASLTFEEERTVGASLGADSIRKGIQASLAGAAIVFIFTMVYYRKTGILAVGCLLLNVLFVLAALAGLGATLTLPGLAGLALTVGMSVDANVIIYERIREELRAGMSPTAAVQAGFERAHWTIMDSNLTTLIIGIILYGFGSGPIKGFAVTLSIGLLASMFCALVVCRAGFELFNMRKSNGELSI